MRWADLYRQIKIQETVFEFLTQQYELAKIQEAKEIPTVKILDPAEIPERRSFPRRTLIVALGALFSLFAAAMWTMSATVWMRVDPKDTRKALVLTITSTIASRLSDIPSSLLKHSAPSSQRNGSRSGDEKS